MEAIDGIVQAADAGAGKGNWLLMGAYGAQFDGGLLSA
jgi:hypothetical protein